MTTPTPTFDLESHRLEQWHEMLRCAEAADGDALQRCLQALHSVERYWAYPGQETLARLGHYLGMADFDALTLLCANLLATLREKSYRAREFIPFQSNLSLLDRPQIDLIGSHYADSEKRKSLKPYFEVLIVHPDPEGYAQLYRHSLANYTTFQDKALYDLLFVDSYHDAMIAVLSNPIIQTVIFVDQFRTEVSGEEPWVEHFAPFLQGVPGDRADITLALKRHIAHVRPDLDCFYLCSDYASQPQIDEYDRIIYLQSPSLFADIHHHILSGIEQRYSTPFFDALRAYAAKPKGAFHALPISQGQSVRSSHWIDDVAQFYGEGIFSAETSSTLGGMDSIMDPKGSISQAQNKAARLFRAKRTFFITNGTTTANKIVMQANLHPDDIVLISSDCHKSIPYSVLLCGAKPIFLETYPLNRHDLYGCVTLKRIKQVLMDLKRQNQLHRVKQITLTNSTFDGLLYNVKRYMMDILAIKPDIIFHWDEAWSSFAYFNPLYQGKTAMSAANSLTLMREDPGYRRIYQQWRSLPESDLSDADYVVNHDLYPDPAQFIVRTYATQSTHKTLTAFRQASMLHIHDEQLCEDEFYESYRTHTTTSPNYQIIASLDFARRQMALEGYELVKNALALAQRLRDSINSSAALRRYFSVLDERQLIPAEYLADTAEPDGAAALYYPALFSKYRQQLFCVDPTRVTIDISNTGIDGPSFRQLLMTQYDIQVNKTSHNTILFIINIGANERSIHYLLESLHHIASNIANPIDSSGQSTEKARYIANLPQTRNYHAKFVEIDATRAGDFQAVDIRSAYYAGLVPANVSYAPLSSELLKSAMAGRHLVSAGFVTPYPPGFPIIVPGQLITYDLLLYLHNIQIKEIHGYHANRGLKVFTDEFLKDKP